MNALKRIWTLFFVSRDDTCWCGKTHEIAEESFDKHVDRALKIVK